MRLFVTDDPASLETARGLAVEAETEIVEGVFRDRRARCWSMTTEKAALKRNRDAVVPRLESLAREGTVAERLGAVELLGDLDPMLGDRALRDFLRSEEPDFLVGTLKALTHVAWSAEWGDRLPLGFPEEEGGLKRVLGLLEHPDFEIVVWAVYLLGALHTDEAAEALLGRLEDPRLGRKALLELADDGRKPELLGHAFEVLARSQDEEEMILGLEVIERFAKANRDPALSARATRMLAEFRDDARVPEAARKRVESELSWLAFRDSVEASRAADTARAEAIVGLVLDAGLIGPEDAAAAVAALRASEDGNWEREDNWGAREAFLAARAWVEYYMDCRERPAPLNEMVRAFAAASRGAFVPEAVYQLLDGGWEDRYEAVQFIHRGRLYQFLVEGGGTYAAYTIAESVNTALADAGEVRRFVRLKRGNDWAEPLFVDPARFREFAAEVGWTVEGIPEPESIQAIGSMIDPARLRLRAVLRSCFHPKSDASALSDAEFARATANRGQTALHRRANDGRVDLVTALLGDGADPNARDDAGRTPLHGFLGWRTTAAIGPLVAAGADLEARDRHGWTPLHDAACWDKPEFVAALLDLGADLHARDRRGFTPLHTAANEGAAASATVLLDRGAEIDARSERTVDLTAEEESERSFELNPSELIGMEYPTYLLWGCGGEVEDGQTPLHRAAFWGHRVLAELLLDRGAKAHARDALNQTPRDLAMARGHPELADLLRSYV
jgi:hypothetical protein